MKTDRRIQAEERSRAIRDGRCGNWETNAGWCPSDPALSALRGRMIRRSVLQAESEQEKNGENERETMPTLSAEIPTALCGGAPAQTAQTDGMHRTEAPAHCFGTDGSMLPLGQIPLPLRIRMRLQRRKLCVRRSTAADRAADADWDKTAQNKPAEAAQGSRPVSGPAPGPSQADRFPDSTSPSAQHAQELQSRDALTAGTERASADRIAGSGLSAGRTAGYDMHAQTVPPGHPKKHPFESGRNRLGQWEAADTEGSMPAGAAALRKKRLRRHAAALSRRSEAQHMHSRRMLVSLLPIGAAVLFVCTFLLLPLGAVLLSPYGIFFSGEAAQNNAVPASVAVRMIQEEYAQKLETIIAESGCDTYDISGAPPTWTEVLAVFAVQTAGRDRADAADVVTFDADRIARLRAVFWDMTVLETALETISSESPETEETVSENAGSAAETVMLHLRITALRAEECAQLYGFSERETEMLLDLLEEQDLLLALLEDTQYVTYDAQQVVSALPETLSETRCAVVEQAALLVGKVSYFWGGKSLVIGWDSRWGTMQTVTAGGSATTGSVRPYGLDCSGFVDWVFYNVSGGTYIAGHGGGTVNQYAAGVKISICDAQPGDLVFTEALNHVGIVCGVSEDGTLQVIHCSGSGNTVVITDASQFSLACIPEYLNESTYLT